MTITRCPNCEAQVLPGDVSCRRCKYDFIMGRQLDSDPDADLRRRRLAIIGASLGGALILAGLIMSFLLKPEEDETGPKDDHPCMVSLQAIQPTIHGWLGRGNTIPECAPTPPGPTACWQEVGISAASVSGEGLEFTLEQTRDGFDLRCRADLDGDGDRALYSANEAVAGVRISPTGVR